ncbi:MAG TPA: enoyl-CoA hydratase/isomerase family protein [Acidimicrobiia bacterium]|nr:enoyl-CoA hydratase/isomerase family protein [Acidimicrobiia bacterium]
MAALGSAYLCYEIRDGAGWLTIDRSATKNAMSLEMYRGVRRAVEEADADPDVSVVVITGVDELFCVGGGMTAEVLFEDESAWPGMGYIPAADGSVRDVDPSEVPVDIERDVLPFDVIPRAGTTVISAVNGLCIGGGLIIAMASDITLASPRARFRVPEVRRGVPDPWMAAMLPAYVGLERAKYLMLTAEVFDADRAYEWGLVSEVVPAGELVDRTEHIVDLVLRGAPITRSVYKAQANRYLIGTDLAAVSAAASEEEKLEGFRSFAERRPPAWIPAGRATGLGRQ